MEGLISIRLIFGGENNGKRGYGKEKEQDGQRGAVPDNEDG